MFKSRKKPSKPEEFQNFITQKIQSEVCERGNYRIIKKKLPGNKDENKKNKRDTENA